MRGHMSPWPSPFGAAEATATPSEATTVSWTEQVQAYTPFISSIVSAVQSGRDATEQVAVLKAQIQNAKRMKAKFPFLSVFYDNRIAKLEASLEAAKARKKVQKEGEAATREWRGIGQTGLIVGIALLAAVTGVVVIGGVRLASGDKRRG